MIKPIKRYEIIVQAGPNEILGVNNAGDLDLKELADRSTCGGQLVVAPPAIEDAEVAAERVRLWGFRAMIGKAYNMAQRLLDASSEFGDQPYVVRVLAT